MNIRKKDTTETFIEKSEKTHGKKYCYDKVKYVGSRTKVSIICNEFVDGVKVGCGITFSQTPGDHIRGQGCPSCKNKDTTETFIKKSEKKHGKKYCYDKVKYVGSQIKVSIICNEFVDGVKVGCGITFSQSPNSHIGGHGCPNCNIGIKDTTETFIEKSEKKHGKKYCYDKVKYINARKKVRIICKKIVDGVKVGCGITFSQTPNGHIQGRGCPNCTYSKGEKAILKFFEDKGWKEGVNFLHQHKTKTCRIDFVIKELNLLIEYNGEQHYIPTSFGSKRKNAHIINLKRNINSDHKRIKFCLKKGSLLIIPYWDFKNIKQILEDFLEGRMPTFSKPPKEVIKYKKIRDRIRKELKITGAEILCGVVREREKVCI